MKGLLMRTLNPHLSKHHALTLLLIWALIAIAWISAAMFLAYVLIGSFTIIDLKLSANTILLVDASLSLTFFLQHSTLVRKGVKQKLTRFIKVEYYNAFYGFTSAIALLLVLVLWQKSPFVAFRADGISYWILRALFLISILGFYWGAKSLGSFDVLGVKPIIQHMTQTPDKTKQITAKGPYRWARHPLYLFMITLIWSCPVLTQDRLLFNILWTAWIVLGTVVEDRDLHREFGRHYHEYSARVPMLIPYKIPKS
jgi:protein-S-isoprenylcysteine O-methyltransferase Ste14